MKTLTLLVMAASMAFAQHRGGPVGHPGYAAHSPVIVRPAPIVVAPRVYVGSYGFVPYGFYGPFGLWSYSFFYPGFGYIVSAPEPKACQKETLKDEHGVKHQVLACKQADGTIKIYSPDGSTK